MFLQLSAALFATKQGKLLYVIMTAKLVENNRTVVVVLGYFFFIMTCNLT